MSPLHSRSVMGGSKELEAVVRELKGRVSGAQDQSDG